MKNIVVNSVLVLYRVDVGDVADVSKVHGCLHL
jgi:hypothetical protein